ncbi:hypothetical protein [Paenibacillus chitinolyticus]|uniref:hypothetical protein n=1 Tax=Paenibacillus chitinolyticus TaxID=79263 RepID=UPI00364F8D1A
MSEAQYRMKLEQYRKSLFSSLNVEVESACAAGDWIASELADMEREKKNTRRPGRMSLRTRLKILFALIVTQPGSRVNVKNVGRN